MKRTINIIDALCDAETLPDEVIDFLTDNHRDAMTVEFDIYFDSDYECDTMPSEIGIISAVDFDNCIKDQEWYKHWMISAAFNAITEYEKRWRDEYLPEMIRLWRMDDAEDTDDR